MFSVLTWRLANANTYCLLVVHCEHCEYCPGEHCSSEYKSRTCKSDTDEERNATCYNIGCYNLRSVVCLVRASRMKLDLSTVSCCLHFFLST
ncbi:hypothetical protein BGZ61DRAFT_131236 [Ilyonectria robusta]|uniref:uncharacterized protein n=1 Tax=Ilyonectria robusta TaxID=1079257 RepID=UPI001E8EA030|nr:uncharacterized protein BGZ61DRAFT_131236 [Ilyonectria robusta]KAH8734882.1 hypothetical protein BGZ61DRAFT_131236 [Ilyonectria robusta]